MPMTMSQRPANPIEARKQAVRKYSRNAVVWSAGSLAVGVVFGLLSTHSFFTWLIIGFVVAVISGGYNYMKVRKIVDHKDHQ